MEFIESSPFTSVIYDYITEEELKDFQGRLVEQPNLGDIAPGCGGIRKTRLGQKCKARGKRGGLRVYYLYLEDLNLIHLLAIFEKGEKVDLSIEEKKILKNLALQLKKSAKTRRIS